MHDRDAHADTLELLKKHRPKGVVHSFSGSAEMAKEILNLGMYIGIGGVLTFKNAKKLPENCSGFTERQISAWNRRALFSARAVPLKNK